MHLFCQVEAECAVAGPYIEHLKPAEIANEAHQLAVFPCLETVDGTLGQAVSQIGVVRHHLIRLTGKQRQVSLIDEGIH